LTASDGTSVDYIEISWDSVAGATLYKVEYSDSSSGTYTVIYSGTSTSYNHGSSALPGKTYWYRVRAYTSDSQSYSGYSNTDTGYRKVGTPLYVNASDGTSETSVTINWGSVSGASSYRIESSTEPESGYSYLSSSTTNSYTHGPTPGVKYYYRVTAYANGKYGDVSDYDDGYRKLTAPTSVYASDGSSTTAVIITWSNKTGTTYYCIERSLFSSSGYSEIDTDTASPYEDTTAKTGTTYYYRIRGYAESSSSYSDYSSSDSGYR
jgi:fibronectin type 3 domain-containing protein